MATIETLYPFPEPVQGGVVCPMVSALEVELVDRWSTEGCSQLCLFCRCSATIEFPGSVRAIFLISVRRSALIES